MQCFPSSSTSRAKIFSLSRNSIQSASIAQEERRSIIQNQSAIDHLSRVVTSCFFFWRFQFSDWIIAEQWIEQCSSCKKRNGKRFHWIDNEDLLWGELWKFCEKIGDVRGLDTVEEFFKLSLIGLWTKTFLKKPENFMRCGWKLNFPKYNRTEKVQL